MDARFTISLWTLSIALLGCASEEAPKESTEGTTQPEVTTEEKDSNLAGGYSKTTVDDAQVIAAAEFAVAEESKKGPKINLKSITTAETQVVAGTNYKLQILVDDNGTEKTVEVVVYEDLQQTRTLTSWTAK
ncbi:MAG: hypothetical protein DWI00_08805 [Planctomycetota bacterium]|nr:MAG: hypothetical protein DWI00_08805 [Planctomycetota bacterium]